MTDLVDRAKALREECRIGVEDRGVMPSFVDACIALNHMAPKLLAHIETLEAEITRLQGEAGEGICTYCDGHGIYEGKDVMTGQSVELACQYCNETGRAQSQRELGNQPRVRMCLPGEE